MINAAQNESPTSGVKALIALGYKGKNAEW
jgi:hypothetical protein